jgi:hypothetical protein
MKKAAIFCTLALLVFGFANASAQDLKGVTEGIEKNTRETARSAQEIAGSAAKAVKLLELIAGQRPGGPIVSRIEGKFVKFTRGHWDGGRKYQDFQCPAQPKPFDDVPGYVRREQWGLGARGTKSCPVQSGFCDSTGEFCADWMLLLGCYVRSDVFELTRAANPTLADDALTQKVCNLPPR